MSEVKIYDAKDFPVYLPRLNALYDDLFSGGKGFRAKLIQMISAHLGVTDKSVKLLSQTIEFIHNASLLHDDLIDRSQLRRGKTAAWVKHSPEYAVLAGDYLLARVMVNLSGHGNIRLIQLTSEVISDLLEGEWIQDSLVRDWSVTLAQLDRVHNLKTASLFKWCLRSPFIITEQYETRLHHLLLEMGTLLGILFQRSDDLLDFNIRNEENKTILGDLKAGYLNSFGAFLIEHLCSEKKLLMLKSQTMDELYAVIGREYFDHRMAEFDNLNKEMINLFYHHCESLKHLLGAEQKNLSDDLCVLPELLYWRKNKK